MDPAAARENAQRVLRRKKITAGIGKRIFLVVISVIFLIPLLWMLSTALKSTGDLSKVPPPIIPQHWAWSNFKEVFKQLPFGTFYLNSFWITLLTTIGSVASNFIVAYGFSCIEWRGRDKVFYLVLGTLFLPFPITLIPMFDMFARLHWINTYLPLVVPAFLGSAFFTFLLRQFLLQIPRDNLDAARIDGASEWRILWQIVAPMARPALGAVAIFSAVGAWNDFLGPLIYLQDNAHMTLSIGIQSFQQANGNVPYNLLMAGSLMIILPLVILFFIFQRYFIRGITMGSFK
ncbi:sugar ABC transporter ATP-binding protein [Mangrovactinospora gilvigrisea]|uniref:Sugar ABC transporter ATP-binding protein n=1 Tax=Mangrovactinospora gilvigrisea TaxID=1428644 RepID=A0A1J7BB27_9ACTN|nr:sugar ABC transporter ATP-binding protein [Mangrovactinospora gilvigrisea]